MLEVEEELAVREPGEALLYFSGGETNKRPGEENFWVRRSG